MNIYSLLKLNRFVKSPLIKGAGIWALHVLNKRYLVLFFDPVLACNLQCRMCYFSNEEKRKTLKGHFLEADLSRIGKAIFPQALKLQIGCGAEPGIFKHNAAIVRLGKQYKIPYISFTTNANLLTSDEITNLLEAGLDEFTISLHGVRKDTYEYLMQGASYDKFIETLQAISTAKTAFPNFKLRINYTVNEQNLEELTSFFDAFKDIRIDVLQVRPIQDMEGEIRFIKNKPLFNKRFNEITLRMKEECAARNITYIAPLQLKEVPEENKSSSIMEAVYCYLSPRSFWQEDMDWRNETFREYSKRTHYASHLFKMIFSKKQYPKNSLNYDIQ
ncbi:MAG: radical SAM protein [Candidatus Symbiothrix sp.]|jgi:MoaA/NifB/PqqE/SkfB family radical SAM enzyme|nr:radical SAM protein [Candidatus Symbiothrix sp.]